MMGPATRRWLIENLRMFLRQQDDACACYDCGKAREAIADLRAEEDRERAATEPAEEE